MEIQSAGIFIMLHQYYWSSFPKPQVELNDVMFIWYIAMEAKQHNTLTSRKSWMSTWLTPCSIATTEAREGVKISMSHCMPWSKHKIIIKKKLRRNAVCIPKYPPLPEQGKINLFGNKCESMLHPLRCKSTGAYYVDTHYRPTTSSTFMNEWMNVL